MPRKADPIRHCKTCGTLLTRKRYEPSRILESMNAFSQRDYCDRSCMAEGFVNDARSHADTYHPNAVRSSAK